MKIVADAHIPFIKEYFDSYGDLILKPGRSIVHHDVKDADMLLVRSITAVNKDLLANTNVKYVGSITAGSDHLDTTWLDEAGIKWDNAVGFNAPPVADYVISIIAALQRKGLLLTTTKKRAAVIGVGNVGRLVAERLQLLNFDVVLCDPVRGLKENDFASTSLESLSEFDLITLHVPLTKAGEYPTYHFINKNFLKRQKLGCILLNTSRGAVIDSEALLESGLHLHWCFDVWEHEPAINKFILSQALIAAPHIAGYSVQSKLRGIDMIYRFACDKKIIAKKSLPIKFPEQTLKFAGENHHWQDILLGIFNPLIMTAMMREKLLKQEDHYRFDEMRNQFNYRHEFSFTHISGVSLAPTDKTLLEKMGMKLTDDSHFYSN